MTMRIHRLEDDAMFAGLRVQISTFRKRRAGVEKYYEFYPIGEDEPIHTVKGTKLAESWLAGYITAFERSGCTHAA